MPQMAPMYWFILFLYFVVLFMFYVALVYYFHLPSSRRSEGVSPISLTKNFNWSW